MGERDMQMFKDVNMKKTDDSHKDETCDTISIPATVTGTSSNGPLHDLSDLMAQLPRRRGLSRYYDGKSASFYDLGMVKSVEDLSKKVVNTESEDEIIGKSHAKGSDGRNK